MCVCFFLEIFCGFFLDIFSVGYSLKHAIQVRAREIRRLEHGFRVIVYKTYWNKTKNKKYWNYFKNSDF